MIRDSLSKIYPKEIVEAHSKGKFYIHDTTSAGLKGRDISWNLKDIIEKEKKRNPNNLMSELNDFINNIRNEWVGYHSIYGFDTAFINVSKHLTTNQALALLKKTFVCVNRKNPLNIVINLNNKRLDEKKKFIKQLYRVLTQDIYSYIIPVFPLNEDTLWSEEEFIKVFKLSSKFGYPCFINNYDNTFDKPMKGTPNLQKLHKYVFGTRCYLNAYGSIGKITINLPRLGKYAKNEDDFFFLLGEIILLAGQALEIKRAKLTENIDKHLPLTAQYIDNLECFFSTIGIIGVNEALCSLINGDILNPAGKAITYKILDFTLKHLLELQKETGYLYNLEESNENIGYSLASLDKYRAETTSDINYSSYTSSTKLPLNYTDDLWEVLEHQYKFEKLYNGASYFDILIGQELDSSQGTKVLVKRILKYFQFSSIVISPIFSWCSNHKYIPGEQFQCNECGKKTKIFTRIGGIIRSTDDLSPELMEVYKKRKPYAIVSKL